MSFTKVKSYYKIHIYQKSHILTYEYPSKGGSTLLRCPPWNKTDGCSTDSGGRIHDLPWV